MRRLQSLEAIEKVKNGDYHVLRDAEWLKYLVLTEEQNINLERISSLENMPQNPVFLYVDSPAIITSYSRIGMCMHRSDGGMMHCFAPKCDRPSRN
ncbi:hypothetical protein BLX87_01700 [Bacillus sp. VT-16-64]|nr:hypothetical protein BLX87_01700 [Bacillus sp. VT-16-64]